MEEQVDRLVDKAWNKFLQIPSDKRLLIAIAGIPGSGKTTLAGLVTTALNARHLASRPDDAHRPPATAVPMDGYHLTRAQLSAMPDPARAHARRGAEFTIDGAAFRALIGALRRPVDPAVTVRAPSFDHAIKDPIEADIAIEPWHRLVVLEGLYLLLDKEPWRSAAALVDERWFVEIGFETARRRLARRHVASGIVEDEEAGDRRARENDLPNGEEIMASRLALDELIVSREDVTWVHE